MERVAASTQAAILWADVAGYRRLLADDEAATLHTLADYRERIVDIVAGHGGQLVELEGPSSVVISGIRFSNRIVKENKIDYCLAMWAVPAGLFAYVAKIFSKTPYTVWALGSDIWKIQDYPFGKLILKKVLKNATSLFADGLELAKDVKNISSRKCEFLASNRILSKDLKEPDYSKFDSTKTNFMYLGRYHENKGTDLLIKAISLLTEEERKKSMLLN